MKAVKFHGANLRLTPPKDWDEAKHGPCLTIYGHRNNGQVTTIWEPTDEERARIAAGANIAMVVAGTTIMPAAMIVADIKVIPEDADLTVKALFRKTQNPLAIDKSLLTEMEIIHQESTR